MDHIQGLPFFAPLYNPQSDVRLHAGHLDGSVYSGEFLDDLPHGKGRQSDLSGVVYVGAWENGYKSGSGVLDFGDGTSYIGEFENGRASDGLYDWGDGTTSRSYQDENGEWQDFEE